MRSLQRIYFGSAQILIKNKKFRVMGQSKRPITTPPKKKKKKNQTKQKKRTKKKKKKTLGGTHN
jgi:hypothetical protein